MGYKTGWYICVTILCTDFCGPLVHSSTVARGPRATCDYTWALHAKARFDAFGSHHARLMATNNRKGSAVTKFGLTN